jgi:flagellin-like hook-associated protein FlgL
MLQAINIKTLNSQNNVTNPAKPSATASETAELTTMATSTDTINISGASLGAYQNTFTPSATNLQASVEKMASTLGRIREEGFAKQSAGLSREQFTQHPFTALLSQANLSSHDVLALLN